MAIEAIKVPEGAVNAGMFNLPPAFDTKKFAASWVDEGQVEQKQQRETLVGTQLSADGWKVWKKDAKDDATKVHGSNKKIYILMCRPRKIQDQVNAIYGDVSKKAFNREVAGETAAGEALQDSGILTEQRLKRVVAGEASLAEDSQLPLNEESAS